MLHFERNLEENLFYLYRELQSGTYRHSHYTSFYINDPKKRHIFKAIIRDRVVHHAVYRILYPIFDKSFIYDSYSCRNNKGVYRAVNRLGQFAKIISQNNTRPCFALKCDIAKFFDSVDHDILFRLVQKKIREQNTLALLWEIVSSYSCKDSRERGGLPIGNLTSQLFANIYLNEFDQFMKHGLKVKYYLRYCDDFIILDSDVKKLQEFLEVINGFLFSSCKLNLHPQKIVFKKLRQGMDFCGYLVLPHHRLLRTKTKKRILAKVSQNAVRLKRRTIASEKFDQSLQSYFGLLKHCHSYKLKIHLEQKFKLLFGDDCRYGIMT